MGGTPAQEVRKVVEQQALQRGGCGHGGRRSGSRTVTGDPAVGKGAARVAAVAREEGGVGIRQPHLPAAEGGGKRLWMGKKVEVVDRKSVV